jgi:antitoxin component of RelBE/YafQ-DinJ toxin-antitoxin module
MDPATEFLTQDECAAVDQALLTAREKFSARVAIYALRSLKQIALQENIPIDSLQTYQIVEWINQDASLQQGTDDEFKRFFAQLVNSSRTPLNHVAQEAQIPVEDLTVSQVIAWFERKSKQQFS